MKQILPFKSIDGKSVNEAGGKGASLGELTKAGFKVPTGFVITSAAFDKYVENNGLVAEIENWLNKVNLKDMESVEEASEVIRSHVLKSTFPDDLSNEILSNFLKLKIKEVAVRSSATAEDGVVDSWAGELDSYLNTGKEDIIENVQKCWASLFTPRAIFYRLERKTEKPVSVAVVVQKMIQAESAGTAFSVHPVTKGGNQMIIEAVKGLGDKLVSGEVTPDTYVIDKTDMKIVEENIVDGRELEIKEIVELSKTVLDIERHYKIPMDVEWAKKGSQFFILQARPITTLS